MDLQSKRYHLRVHVLRQLAQRVEAHEHSGEHDVAQHDLQVLEGSGDRDGILLRALVGFGLPGSTAGRRTYRPGRPVPWCVGGLIAFSTRSTGVVIRQCIRVMRRVIFRESGSSDFFRFQACATVNKLLTMAHSGAAVPSGSSGRKLHVRQVSAWRSTNRVRSPSKSLNSASSCGVIWLGSLRHHGSERLPWPFPRSRSLCVLSCEPWLCWTSCCGGFGLSVKFPCLRPSRTSAWCLGESPVRWPSLSCPEAKSPSRLCRFHWRVHEASMSADVHVVDTAVVTERTVTFDDFSTD